MSTLEEHKAAIKDAAELVVYGLLHNPLFPVTDQFPRTVSDFDTERLQFRDSENTTNVRTVSLSGLDLIWMLTPGNKLVQVRTWMAFEEVNSSNDPMFQVASTEIVVHRALIDASDGTEYASREMLENQQELLARDLWTDLFEVQDYVIGNEPEISSVPTQTGQVVSYTVSLQARVTPE